MPDSTKLAAAALRAAGHEVLGLPRAWRGELVFPVPRGDLYVPDPPTLEWALALVTGRAARGWKCKIEGPLATGEWYVKVVPSGRGFSDAYGPDPTTALLTAFVAAAGQGGE